MLKRLVMVTTVFGFLLSSGLDVSVDSFSSSKGVVSTQGFHSIIEGNKPTRGVVYLHNIKDSKKMVAWSQSNVTDQTKALREYLSDLGDNKLIDWVIDNSLYPLDINDWYLSNSTVVKEFLGYIGTLYPDTKESVLKLGVTSKDESLFLSTRLLYDYLEQFFGLDKRELMLTTGNIFPTESLYDNFGDGRYVSNKDLLNFLYLMQQTYPTQSDITSFLETKSAFKTDSNTNLDGIALGDSLDNLLGYLGEPDEILHSEFDYDWYTYSLDLSKLRQYGVQDGKVVALYSNSPNTIYWQGHGVGDPIASIPYQAYNNMMQPNLYLNRNGEMSVGSGKTHEHVVFFRDRFKGDTVEGILVEYGSKRGTSYITSSQERNKHFARQLELLTNTYRVKHDKGVLKHNEDLSKVTEKYATRMYIEGFFGHYDPTGQSPSDRVAEAGLNMVVGENIAMGFTTPQDAFSGFVNSQPHWENLLGAYEGHGTGVFGNHYAHLFHY